MSLVFVRYFDEMYVVFPLVVLCERRLHDTSPLFGPKYYIVAKFIPPSFTYQQNKKFFYDLRHYFSDDPHLYKEGVDGVIRHCVPKNEHEYILCKCHSESYGGHHARDWTAHKVFNSSMICVNNYFIVNNVRSKFITSKHHC